MAQRNFVNRFNAQDLRKSPEGFLDVPVIIASEGVFPYGANLDFFEYIPSVELNTEACISSCKGAIFTDGHPYGDGVSVENYSHLIKGSIHSVKSINNGEKIVGRVKIYDRDTIDKIFYQKVVQVSIGYKADVVHQQGQFKGQNYQGVQKGLVINHLALVPVGRAGDKTKLLLNSKERSPTVTIDTRPNKLLEEYFMDSDLNKQTIREAVNESLSAFRQNSLPATEEAKENKMGMKGMDMKGMETMMNMPMQMMGMMKDMMTMMNGMKANYEGLGSDKGGQGEKGESSEKDKENMGDKKKMEMKKKMDMNKNKMGMKKNEDEPSLEDYPMHLNELKEAADSYFSITGLRTGNANPEEIYTELLGQSKFNGYKFNGLEEMKLGVGLLQHLNSKNQNEPSVPTAEWDQKYFNPNTTKQNSVQDQDDFDMPVAYSAI